MNHPLPIKNGISPSYKNIANQRGLLLDFLIQEFPHIPTESWLKRMHDGEVVNQAGEPLHASSPLTSFSQVFYYREVSDEPVIPFKEQILFQDEHLLVVDKPHFLPVTPGGQFLHQTLLTRLRIRTGIASLSPIHRLDKDTAGIILFAIQTDSRNHYQQLFQQKHVRKIYHAIAPTRIDLHYPHVIENRLIEHPEYFFLSTQTPGTPNSKTTITLLNNNGATSLYQLEPTTGKKHQLRVHMNDLGMPIINDVFYPNTSNPSQIDYSKPLQLLAKSIEFTDPLTHETRCFESRFNLLLA